MNMLMSLANKVRRISETPILTVNRKHFSCGIIKHAHTHPSPSQEKEGLVTLVNFIGVLNILNHVAIMLFM